MAQSLGFSLRCNSLTCRKTLNDRAAVTTSCAETLGLAPQTQKNRICPACQANLRNPDDVVSTVLNPTEDYKTSVLGGLDPTMIIECAGRALSFWAYQTTQEICYQEYLSKGLTEKYSNLNTEKEKLINSANAEISSLQNKLADMQMAQDQLQKRNDELIALYHEKCKKHTQMTNLYNLLKSRAMPSQIQAATAASRHFDALPSTERRNVKHSTEQLFWHQRSGSASSKIREDRFIADTGPMPPPQFSFSVAQNAMTTPSLHRTCLPAQPGSAVLRESRGLAEEPKYFVNHGRYRDFSYNPG
ncbi:conserved hypothetical protein [Talaromyces stipitatus ATCC 10500]|uniref:Cyclin B1 interacting protein 1 n=1 Tax=Talaromyces stipitatus (strain ATCC 10500 / CBS 375.48 / QM 6759 / NRRL 1006) TaxID=441959 RepID=B8MRK1_TALSN|nr:uncharacterized protein TSTA_056590 [Talaromyces stipitatus ATCC 10500]EED13158.1 conserved hypothetical protein [Talaromyces stipitatus ATCC 10500]